MKKKKKKMMMMKMKKGKMNMEAVFGEMAQTTWVWMPEKKGEA